MEKDKAMADEHKPEGIITPPAVTPPVKVEYTPEQQTHINSLIEGRLNRQKKDHDTLVEGLQTQINELNLKTKTTPKTVTPADGETLETLRAQIAELKTA